MFGRFTRHVSSARSRALFIALSLAGFSCAVYDGGLLGPNDGFAGAAGEAAAGTPSEPGGAAGALSNAGGAKTEAGSGGVLGGGASGEAALAGAAGDAGDGGEGSVAGAANGGHSGANAAGGTSGAPMFGGSGGTTEIAGSAGALGASGADAGSTSGASGSAGTGGSASVALCSDHPLVPKASWVPSASHQSTTPPNPPSKLTDNTATRWSSGKPQSGDEWVQIDFGAQVALRGINLQQGVDGNDYPRGYVVIVSNTAKDLTGTVRASGIGTSGVTTTIALPKVVFGRYLLIKQLEKSLSWWSVAELEVNCTDN